MSYPSSYHATISMLYSLKYAGSYWHGWPFSHIQPERPEVPVQFAQKVPKILGLYDK